MRVHLTTIDPQNDFVMAESNPWGLPKGSLFVEGGHDDAMRLGSLITDIAPKIDAWSITLDQHHEDADISHPGWYVDNNGDEPPPVTTMTYDAQRDVFIGSILPAFGGGTREYRARRLDNIPTVLARAVMGRDEVSYHAYTAWYIQKLAERGRNPHVVWPVHCRIGFPGANVHPAIAEAISHWTGLGCRSIGWVAKGSNPFTEHFSAVQAEVPLPVDPGTQLNAPFVAQQEAFDINLWTGWALSHCLANTGEDTANAFRNKDVIKRWILITDATSNVPGFEALGEAYVDRLCKLGMQLKTCAEVRALLA